MKAGDKIYLHPTAKGEVGASWLTFPLTNEDVEYVRADVLIEKAENFFVKKFEIEDYIDTIDIDGSPIYNYIRIIEDFKNYMK